MERFLLEREAGRQTMRRLVRLAVIGGGLLVATTASAQQQQQQGQGTPYATQPVYTAPPPPNGQGGEYVAPTPQQQPQQQQVVVQQQIVVQGPREITTWEEGDPVPPGYHPDTRTRKGLIIGGAVTFGVTYLLSALVGAVALSCNDVTGSSCGGLGALLIPAAGPFIAIATAHADAGGAAVLIIDGLAQVGGVTMLVLGIAMPKTVLVRNDFASGKKIPVATFEPVIGPQSGLKITF